MNRPDFTAATAATLPTRATAATLSNVAAAHPLQAATFSTRSNYSNGGAGFPAAFRAVQADVARYIASGGGAPAGPAPTALTVDGAALRARLATAKAIGGTSEAVDGDAQQAFLQSIKPYAEETAGKLGVAPELVAAHAALESGWGQRPLPGNNLFGIKANSQWQGESHANATHEVEHGLLVKKVESFRGYPDTAAAFRDYAGLLLDNPRYQQALNVGSNARAFARGLAQGGYATDPGYADKLARIAARIGKLED